jgi:hypothetical protein
MLAPSEQNAFRFKRKIKVPLPPDIFVLYISNLKKNILLNYLGNNYTENIFLLRVVLSTLNQNNVSTIRQWSDW